MGKFTVDDFLDYLSTTADPPESRKPKIHESTDHEGPLLKTDYYEGWLELSADDMPLSL